MGRRPKTPRSQPSDQDDLIAVEARITGRVQGVWFRGWTVQEAGRLGLAGWVRNCADGSVEARFEGPGDAVQAMLCLCRQGPRMARVVDVVSRTVALDPSAMGFEVRR
ncbi:MAG: acylphosphatase [Paracoccaceae bacterium]|nr:acylphosphatase [Paracoccaceae bacterium]